jgi:hypothetical protein
MWYPAQPVTAATETGRITYIDGSMKKATEESDWVGAATNDPVESGSRVKTLVDSRGELDLSELELIRLAPVTEVDIVKLYEETADQKLATEIHVEEGDIWANIATLDAETSLDISTDVSVTGVRGTVFRMSTTKKGTEIRVYTGRIEVSNRPPEQLGGPTEVGSGVHEVSGPTEVAGPREVTMEEWTYIVREMQRISIGADHAVGFMGSFNPGDPDETTDWVSWNKDRDRAIGR